MRQEQKNRGYRVQSYLPEFVAKKIKQSASLRNISESELVALVLINHVEQYLVLTDKERRMIKLIDEERRTKEIEFVRSKSAKKINFIKNVRKQLQNWAMNKRDIDINDIIDNMRLNVEIAKINGWTKEVETLNKILINAEKGCLELTLPTTEYRKNHYLGKNDIHGVEYIEENGIQPDNKYHKNKEEYL